MVSNPAGRRSKNQLLALGSAAVLAIYTAGYVRTRAADQKFDANVPSGRRPAIPPAAVATVLAEVPPLPAPGVPLPPATPNPSLGAPAAAASERIAEDPKQPAANTAISLASAPVAETAAAAASAIASPVAAPLPAPVAPAQPAPETTAAMAAPAPVIPLPKWKDGKFSGWGSCRHGDLQATIEIKGGRIVSAVISDCRTRYSSSVIDKIVPQVVARQSADVDTVSGATQSADAFYWAVTSALASAKPEPPKAP